MEATTQPRPKYRRRTYVVNRAFQFKYTLIITLVGATIATLLGLFLYGAISESTEVLKISLQDNPELIDRLMQDDRQLVIILIAGIGALIVALLVWGVFMTHRVAGPMFIITRYTNQIADGIYPNMRPLRKNDELRDFFDAYKDMVDELAKRDEDDYNVMIEAVKVLEDSAKKLTEKSGETSDIAKALSAEGSRLEELIAKKAKRLNRG